MKTKIFIMLCMMVCVNGMFAQTENEFESQDTTEVIPESEVKSPSKRQLQASVAPAKQDNYEELTQLLREFNKHALAEQQLEKPDYSISVPICGKGFFRRHHITQRLEISLLGGSDKQEDPDTDMEGYADDIRSGKEDGETNFGLNVGYSLVFVPGKIEGDQLCLNRFGFGYSLGLIASMDKQEKYGMTSDLLFKLGVETGNNHALGIGLDFLVGTGTSPVAAVIFDDDDGGDDLYDYDTEWCLKYGFQLWVRSNLLHASVKNADIRLFARYVYSKDPTNDNDFVVDGKQLGYYIWSPDSWQFGLTFCYEF